MKYAAVFVTCAFLGGLTGLFSAWGAAAYSSPNMNPDPRPGWFVSMPALGVIGGSVVGLIAVAVARVASRPVSTETHRTLIGDRPRKDGTGS